MVVIWQPWHMTAVSVTSSTGDSSELVGNHNDSYQAVGRHTWQLSFPLSSQTTATKVTTSECLRVFFYFFVTLIYYGLKRKANLQRRWTNSEQRIYIISLNVKSHFAQHHNIRLTLIQRVIRQIRCHWGVCSLKALVATIIGTKSHGKRRWEVSRNY